MCLRRSQPLLSWISQGSQPSQPPIPSGWSRLVCSWKPGEEPWPATGRVILLCRVANGTVLHAGTAGSGGWTPSSVWAVCTAWTGCGVFTGACRPRTPASLRLLSTLSSTRASNVNCRSSRPTPAWTKRRSPLRTLQTLWAWCSRRPPQRHAQPPSLTPTVLSHLCTLLYFDQLQGEAANERHASY